jgi:hypothetical protein
VIIFLIINLQQIILNLQKFQMIIKINPTHLIEIEKQNWKEKKTTKIQQNNAKLITIKTKIQHNYF